MHPLRTTGFARQYLLDLEAQGVITKKERGFWTYDSVRTVITFLRDTNRRGSTAPRQALQQAKAAEVQQKIDIKNRVLIPTEDAIAMVDKMCGMVRMEFGSLPARITRDLALRAEIDREVNATLKRISEALAKAASDVRGGIEAVDAGQDDDA
jgi:hypothetical protein